MTRRDGVEPKPRMYRAAGEWPTAELIDGAPRSAKLAQELSRRLRDALAGRSVTDIAREAGIARSTIYDVVSGETWPDFVTICKLEDALEERLFP